MATLLGIDFGNQFQSISMPFISLGPDIPAANATLN